MNTIDYHNLQGDNKVTQSFDGVPAALPPSFDAGYLEALPIVSTRHMRTEDREDTGHAFRFQGFGKYRVDPMKKKAPMENDIDEDTDG